MSSTEKEKIDVPLEDVQRDFNEIADGLIGYYEDAISTLQETTSPSFLELEKECWNNLKGVKILKDIFNTVVNQIEKLNPLGEVGKSEIQTES